VADGLLAGLQRGRRELLAGLLRAGSGPLHKPPWNERGALPEPPWSERGAPPQPPWSERGAPAQPPWPEGSPLSRRLR
jgi:hypothetical protein